MMDFTLIACTVAVFGLGYASWRFWSGGQTPSSPQPPARRREDARDWQRRLGVSSLFTANFLQPTQNEVLETLYILDHLAPGWESSEADFAERCFLSELALNFPTLLKANSIFPLPFSETLPIFYKTRSAGTGKSGDIGLTEDKCSLRREAFRTHRAQLNALEQIVSGPSESVENQSTDASFGSTDEELPERGFRPVLFATALLLLSVAGASAYLFHSGGRPTTRSSAHESAISTPDPAVAIAEHSPTPSAPEEASPSAALSTPVPAVETAISASTPNPSPTPTPDLEKITLAREIAASQQRAVTKYPALTVEGSEINLRFVFRYKNMVQQNSPRLLDPHWPEQLAEECAAASGPQLKRGAFTQVTSSQR